MYTSTKLFREYPNAYRNPQSKTDCYLLHGYCRDFHLIFGSKELDRQGFVFDFGDLDEIKYWLESKFDHTVLLQADDPHLFKFKLLQEDGLMRVVTLPLVTCEGIAQYVGLFIDKWVKQRTRDRVSVLSCECRENGKNSAVWLPTTDDYRLTFDDLEDMRRDMEATNVREE